MSKKGLKRMQLMRKLSGTSWGANSAVLKNTYQGYVRPALEYGISAWGTCSQAQMNKVEKVQNHCLRIITGGMRTTPIHVMEHHTGIRPIRDQRDEKMHLQFAKIKHMKDQPLHEHTKRQDNKRLKRENFISMGQTLETTTILGNENIVIKDPSNTIPPWRRKQMFTVQRGKNTKLDKRKNTSTESLYYMIDKNYPKTSWIRVYTDGSVVGPNRNGGAGVYIEWPDQTSSKLSSPVGQMSTPYKTEEKAVNIAIEYLARNEVFKDHDIVIFTDADDLLQNLENPQNSKIDSILETLKTTEINKNITFQWIPGHFNIEGNENADHLAKEGAMYEQPKGNITLEDHKKLIKQTHKENWSKKRPEFNKTDQIHHLNRNHQVAVFRLRTGHNKLNQHMARIGIKSTPMCDCGDDTENACHLLMHCQLFDEIRKRYWPTPTPLDTKLYGTAMDLRRTADFFADIGRQP